MKTQLSNIINWVDIQRASRMAIAALISVLIYKSFNFTHGYWILIATVITIQANVGASIKRAKERIIGTVLGVLIGVMISVVLPQHSFYHLLIAPIFVFFAVYLFSTSYAHAIFFASALVIILLTHNHPDPWTFALERIIDTAIGVTVGLSCAFLLWPDNAKNQLQQTLARSITASHAYFTLLVDDYFHDRFDKQDIYDKKNDVETMLQKGRVFFDEFSYEPSVMNVSTEAAYSVILSLEQIHDIYQSITLTLRRPATKLLAEEETQRLQAFIGQINDMFTAITDYMASNTNADWSKLDAITFRIQQLLLTQDIIETAITGGDEAGLNVLLFVHDIKKIANELKYIAESVKQFFSSL